MDKTDGSIRLYRCILDNRVFAHPTALKIWIWCLCKATYKKRDFPLRIGSGTTIVTLLPGQFIFGRHKAEMELKIDESTIYHWIKKFASKQFGGMIDIKANNQFSIITICKWDEYQMTNYKSGQPSEQPKNNQRTAVEHPQNTYNKVNNVNTVNKKKEGEKRFSPHHLTEIDKTDINKKPYVTEKPVIPKLISPEPLSTSKACIISNELEPDAGEFKPPTLSEVINYCDVMKYKIDIEFFLNYYEMIGWVYGEGEGEPMKDWKIAVDEWDKNPAEIEIPEIAFINTQEISRKSRRKPLVFKPPTLDETIIYFSEHGFDEKLARRAFEGYAVADWHDSRGNKIMNWKQKMIQVWFREEHKAKERLDQGQHPGQTIVSGEIKPEWRKR